MRKIKKLRENIILFYNIAYKLNVYVTLCDKILLVADEQQQNKKQNLANKLKKFFEEKC
ncbi:hypothetical protein QTI77_14155 [Clostridium perfringens]|nr:hypothetical protein [Clostridium perfringens]MDM0889199.1 hypothetical protein [Clostridium perfringens]MDM0900990.1 hypothetical protein [Clostridium perfringens]MDM0906897.1 hypothetical protein [Clostridium perfringens]MDM0909855.1 hypothetical protein [Clostridium perfringens]